jgi:hypothetical protein
MKDKTPTEKIFDEILLLKLSAAQRIIIENCKDRATRDRERYYAHIPMEKYKQLLEVEKEFKKLLKENEELKIENIKK